MNSPANASSTSSPTDVDLARFQGLDLLSSAVVVLDRSVRVAYANQAAELLLDSSRKNLVGQPGARIFGDQIALDQLVQDAQANGFGQRKQIVELRRIARDPIAVQIIAIAQFGDEMPLVLEFSEIEQQLKVDREERQLDQTESNRLLLRNLAHEIKNPLGGIRGAAQLLEDQLELAGQREYTRVIISESDRLQSLVDRLLAPHRTPRMVGDVNIHQVFERVRAVIHAEFPRGLSIMRDYDASIPDLRGDQEQLIQALLNIVRNAAQALEGRIAAGDARIVLRTRVARQVSVARARHKLALDLHVIDNGPGIAEDMRERIFYPLVSGRDGGSGLGLTLAQTLVQQHDGAIEVESRRGHTDFRILLPLP